LNEIHEEPIMKQKFRWLILITILLAFLLSACAPEAAPEEEEKPVTLEPIAGTDLNRLTLTEKAAERLGLETAPVVAQEGQVAIPYAALLYDPSGQAWVYVNVGPLAFERQKITVDSIQGDQVILSEGPEAGANVVTMGATELYGSESEFEEE
jgi:hypothetical protein